MLEFIQAALAERASPLVRSMGMRVESASEAEVVLALPVTPYVVHIGNVLCGQAMLAAADTVMWLAILAHRGGPHSMATIQLQMTFQRAVPAHAGEVRVVGRVQKSGRSVAFGEILLRTPDGTLFAHATGSYAVS